MPGLVASGGLGRRRSVHDYTDDSDLVIEGSIPHPLLFNQHADGTRTAPGTRDELAIHLQVAYIVPVNRASASCDLGGPASSREAVESSPGFTYSEDYPYDEATFSGAERRDRREQKVRLRCRRRRRLLLHEERRRGRLIVRFLADEGDVLAREVDAGGAMVGGGLRSASEPKPRAARSFGPTHALEPRGSSNDTATHAMGASAARAAGVRTVPGAARRRARRAWRPGTGSRAGRLDRRHRRHGRQLGPAHPGHGAHRRPAPAIERRGHDARGSGPRSLRPGRGEHGSSAPSSCGSVPRPASSRCSATSSRAPRHLHDADALGRRTRSPA